MTTKTLYLCGAGNSEGVRLALNLNERERRWSEIVLLDDDERKHGQRLLGVSIIGAFARLADVRPGCGEVVNLVARSTQKRHAVAQRLRAFGVPFTSLIHPSVDLRGAEFASDVLVYEGAILAPETHIAEGCVVFMRAVIGHEASVGEGCVIASGGVLNARVVLEERVYVGTNAAVLPEVCVGRDATIGACSAVLSDVPPRATAIGVPAECVVHDPPTRLPDREPASSARVECSGRALFLAEQIAQAWAHLLGRARIDLDDSFFSLGGSSLLALQVRAHLQRSLGVEVALTDLFRFPTAKGLALRLAGSPAAVRASGPGAARAQARLYAQWQRSTSP